MSQRNRRILQAFIFALALVFVLLFMKTDHRLTDLFVYSLSAYTLYSLLQYFLKLGMTLPFGWLIYWVIMAIMQWNAHQQYQSYNFDDYYLAIASILLAAHAGVVYFENKYRW